MKTLALFLLTLIGFSAYAQKSDSTRMSYRIIRAGMIEHSTELKSKPHIKNGESEIKLGRNVVARGLYKNGERFGRWTFYKAPDSIEQVYNYSTKKLERNSAFANISCEIDSAKVGDRIIKATKIGGFYSGLRLLIKLFSPSKEFKSYAGIHPVYLIFHINENGKLIKYETETGIANLKRSEIIPLTKLKPEDFDFTPAYLNGKAVSCKLIFESKLTVE
ncbi:hypothetical protein [Pedobacter sp. Leaf170]|uniref:hypothetical protein n=1 Tax=Pedobacter sp. Leaf170 TaxID=2876558 RepID=UPI001E35E308|nr:hypothetical protein [Pedobacter sp. Leaf170]